MISNSSEEKKKQNLSDCPLPPSAPLQGFARSVECFCCFPCQHLFTFSSIVIEGISVSKRQWARSLLQSQEEFRPILVLSYRFEKKLLFWFTCTLLIVLMWKYLSWVDFWVYFYRALLDIQKWLLFLGFLSDVIWNGSLSCFFGSKFHKILKFNIFYSFIIFLDFQPRRNCEQAF